MVCKTIRRKKTKSEQNRNKNKTKCFLGVCLHMNFNSCIFETFMFFFPFLLLCCCCLMVFSSNSFIGVFHHFRYSDGCHTSFVCWLGRKTGMSHCNKLAPFYHVFTTNTHNIHKQNKSGYKSKRSIQTVSDWCVSICICVVNTSTIRLSRLWLL